MIKLACTVCVEVMVTVPQNRMKQKILIVHT